MKYLKLKEKPTLKDYQGYVNILEIQRDFIDQNAIVKCLLLGKEMGELFKAVCKTMKLKTDINANVSPVNVDSTSIFQQH